MRALLVLVMAIGMLAGCPGTNPSPKNAATAKCPSYGGNTNDRCSVN